MRISRIKVTARRLSRVAAITGLAAFAAGCSGELASIDDEYVPVSVNENYPIRVLDKPMRLTLDVGPAGLRAADVEDVAAFARGASSSSSTPVIVSYPAASARARRAADQAAGVLAQHGVPRSGIHLTRYDGKSDVVVMTYSQKVASTKPCGDWSENLRAKQSNDDLGTNFGCSFQQNVAAMVTDPEDLVRARTMPPARSAPQNTAIQTYETGGWTTPNTTTNISASD